MEHFVSHIEYQHRTSWDRFAANHTMASLPNDTSHVHPNPEKIAYKVAVIGGGICGLALTIGLLKYEHIDVQIYEAAPSFGEIGAGITVGPNAQRALELIGPEAEAAFAKHKTPNFWASHKNDYTWNIVVSLPPDDPPERCTRRFEH